MEEKESISYPTEKEFRELDLSKLKEKINAIPSIIFFKNATIYLNHIQLNTSTEWELLQNVIHKGHSVILKNYPKVLEKMAAPSPACGTHIISKNPHSYNNAFSAYNKYQNQNSDPSSSKHQQGGQVQRTVEEISIATTSESSPGQHVASSDRHLVKSASSAYNKYRPRYTGPSTSNYRRGGQSRRSVLKNPMVATPPSTPVACSGRHLYNCASSSSNAYQSQDTDASSKHQQGCQDGRNIWKIPTVASPAPPPSTLVISSDRHSYKSVSSAYNKYRSQYTGPSSSDYRRGGQSRRSVLKNPMVATPAPPPGTLVISSDRHSYKSVSSAYNKYRSQYTGPSSSNYRRRGQARRSVQNTPLQSRQLHHLRRL